jgi:recombinational DNA repair ATPase RecF
MGCQVLATATAALALDAHFRAGARMFHVEHGTVVQQP